MKSAGQISLLIYIDSLACGGAEKSLVSLLPALIERGYDITLMVSAGGGLFEQLLPEGFRPYILSTPATGMSGRLARILFSLRMRMPVKRHSAELYWSTFGKRFPAQKKVYDVAIAYHQGFPTFYVAEKVKARKKIAWINVDLIKAGYNPTFCKSFYTKYDSVVTVSDTLSAKILADGYIEVTPVTVHDILSESLIRSLAFRENVIDNNDGHIHLTTVGRLVPQKGYDLLLGAAYILSEKGIDFRWHIVGGGSLELEIKKEIAKKRLSEKIILEGERLNPYPYIKACDIYVQTSKFEGFGLTVGEAKILHKPIVSTDFPVIHDQISNGVNGLIAGMNAESIAENIIQLIGDINLRDRFVSNLRNEVNTSLYSEAMKVIDLIEN